MSKLKTVAVGGALLAALGLSTGALLMAYVNRPVKAPVTSLAPVKLDMVADYKPDAAKGDRVVALASAHKGGNTSFEWTCGKKVGSMAEEHYGHWDSLNGAVAYNAKAGELRAVELVFATGSFQSDQPQLTRTLTSDEKWFDCERFPTASFRATDFAARTPETEKEAAALPGKPTEGWNRLIRGKFSLNGIEKALAIPAKVSFMGESVKIESNFVVRRSEFDVAKRQNSPTGVLGSVFTVDDEVRLAADITAAPDMGVLISELGALIRKQQGEIRQLNDKLDRSNSALAQLGGRVGDLEDRPAAGPAAAVDWETLPESFTDALVYPHFEHDFKQKDDKGNVVLDAKTGQPVMVHFVFEERKVPFTMKRIPGDPAKGIAPFYMAETEVTWDLFKPWGLWENKDPESCGDECKADLRPSNAAPYLDNNHRMGYNGTPAMGMSRLTAEKFCKFLSERTGRRYRLPTEAEWELAHALGGGDPADNAVKMKSAVCKENSDDTGDDSLDRDEKLFGPRVGRVKSKAPNRLGLYDMLGNVAEWVKTKGSADENGRNTFVRGGDFMTPAEQLTGARREESNNMENVKESWNYTYPQTPKSRWWYKDRFSMGFRLVCEPVNLPKP